MNKESFITTKKKTRHLGIKKTTNTNNDQLDGKNNQTHTHVVNCRSHKSKMEIRNEKDNYKHLIIKWIDYGKYFKYSTTQIRYLTRMDITRKTFLATVRHLINS